MRGFNFISNILLPLGDLVFNSSVYSELIKHRKFNKLSEHELLALQNKKLNELLIYSINNCKFYSRINSSKKIDINDFPIINKKIVRENTDEFISKKYKKSKLNKIQSSGSTGLRSEVYLSEDEISTTRAIMINWWEMNGYNIGDSFVQTGITPNRGVIKAIKDFFFNTQYIVAFGLNENEILSELKKIKKQKKQFLFGFASSLYLMAKVSIKHNLDIRFTKVMSQGDKLFDHYIKTIKEAFNCDVVEDYGLSEGFMVGQKVDLKYFYIYTPSIFLEILDENNLPVKDGKIGRIILTKLDGYSMPLIRFDSGDLGVKLPFNEYPNNRRFSFPLLKQVIGRNTDIIKTRKGKNLIVHTFTGIFEFFDEISQFQIIQNNIDYIDIKYIPSNSFKFKILRKIENKFYGLTNADLKIRWIEVKIIMPSKSGKPEIIINNLIKKKNDSNN